MYTNLSHWVNSFKLVRQIVGGVDYKGVREIMKICIEKAASLPPGLQRNERLDRFLKYNSRNQ